MSKFQNVATKRKGLRCEIQIMNHSGHDVLTTYDTEVDNSVEVAQAELTAFFNECIAEFEKSSRGGLKPLVTGRTADMAQGDTTLVDPLAPDFDLSLYTQILIQPVPLVGG